MRFKVRRSLCLTFFKLAYETLGWFREEEQNSVKNAKVGFCLKWKKQNSNRKLMSALLYLMRGERKI